MIPFTKAHAYGNDFLYVLDADVLRAARRALAPVVRSATPGLAPTG
jgi:hypothetical protein